MSSIRETEDETRKNRIDKKLQKAGWNTNDQSQVLQEVDTKNSDFNRRIYKYKSDTLSEPNKAYADYVLLDSQGNPIAVIEAKKASTNPDVGQKQAVMYVEDIKKNGPDVYKPTCACAYVDMALTKAASTKFANNPANKAIVDFVKAYTIPTALVNSSLAFYMDESGGDMEETAKNFLSNSNIWESWVPSNVRSKVKAAL